MNAAACAHTDADYRTSPFCDDADLQCRTVAIRTARKAHTCYGITGKQDHAIQAGDRYRYEKAFVDRTFWGEYRICLDCMDKHLEGKI